MRPGQIREINWVNAIAAITSHGLLAVELSRSSVSGDSFFDFLGGTLIPQMKQFDGLN